MSDFEDPSADAPRTDRPHSARVWHYLLGGTDHYPVDAATGDLILEAFPDIARIARLQRGFQGLPRASLQQATRARLEAFVRATGGVPGSLFMVEAGTMLDHLMTVLFVPGGEA